MHENKIGQNVLVTTDTWFYAPDGLSYRAAFGKLKAVRSSEDTLGIRTNAKSTNWYMEVGNLTIAGCQVHFVVQTDKVNFGSVTESLSHEAEYKEATRLTNIYNANGD